MKAYELGEFGLIKRLIERVTQARRGRADNATPFGFKVVLDVGDDAAAWQAGRAVEVFTTDTMVEGVHFTRQTTPWVDVGWKLMASNVSDVAAMGGLPLYALVTLGLAPDVLVSEVDDLYEGMLTLNGEYGVAIVGGDIVRSPVNFFTISLTGATEGALLTRSAARPGDRVAVTGRVGSSGGGLELVLKGVKASPGAERVLLEAHRRPRPRIAEGRVLVREGVRAAMDVSDGVLDDLGKLCQASGVSAVLRAAELPVHPALKEAFPSRYQELALGGGEDYELLFTAPEPLMSKVLPLLPSGATVIGEIAAGRPGKVTVLDASGHEASARGGWDHFR